MTEKDNSTIHRMLGVIEGVAFALEEKIAAPLFDAVEVIHDVIEKEVGDTE